MGMINSIRLGSLASLVAVTVAGSPALAQQPKKPNIVLMLMDNPGYGELGVYGGGMWGKWHLGSAEQILDAIKQAGIENDTLVIFTSDNGPEATNPWEGDNGPWRGTYFTAMEGSLRAPFIIRWPGKVPAGRVSNEIVHIVDLFTTLARVGGAEVPKDRPIDGVDQLDFFLGKQDASNREGFPAYVADRLSAVKWRNWKAHFIWQDNMYAPPQTLPLPKVINLLTDRKEERDVGAYNSWVADPVVKIVGEFEASLKKYPPIKLGTPDPYTPPEPSSR